MSDAAATVQQNIVVRNAEDSSDFGLGVALQQAIWGYAALDTVPDQMFVVAKKTGGQALLAFDGDTAVGFALAFVALKDGITYLHSHMVGVLAEYRDRGVGRLLKLAQRDDALARGIDLIEWTFDPLQLKNARFNIARLGAIVRHYIPNLYGRTSSPLHGGLPTDRLVAEWCVRSRRVENAVSDLPSLVTGVKAERIAIPGDVRELCQTRPDEAKEIQSRVRMRFEQLLDAGYAATGFEFNKLNNSDNKEEGVYLLEPYED
jgi:predicted GNAT superfamily acetyltransferase